METVTVTIGADTVDSLSKILKQMEQGLNREPGGIFELVGESSGTVREVWKKHDECRTVYNRVPRGTKEIQSKFNFGGVK